MSVLQQRFIAVDVSLYYWCFGARHWPLASTVSRSLSKLGDGSLYLIIGLLLAWLEPVHGINFLLAGFLAFAIELPVYLFLKQTIKRDRPCDRFNDITPQIIPADKFSLPSGHSAAAFVFATLIGFYYPDLMLLAYAVAGLIGLSRVFLGVHYPTDIIAGSVLGVGAGLLGLVLNSFLI